jgi:hypothetical protein
VLKRKVPGRTGRQLGRRRATANAESGQAVLLVVAMMAVALTVPGVVIASTIGQVPGTVENLNWNAAYEAAEAGLNDYIQQLDAAGSFTQWTSGRSVCPASTSNANDAAFCGWVSVNPTSQSVPQEAYEYSLPSTKGGGLELTVSGKAGSPGAYVVRTFTYRIVPQNTFLDDIYWTNYETIDPNLQNGCSARYYSSSYGPSSCWIQFASNDTLDGPIFSNDTFRLCGSPTFNGPVESAAASRGQPLYVQGYSCTLGTPTGAGWPPTSSGNEPLPTTVAEASAASYVGCYIASSTSSTTPASNVTLSLSVSGGMTKMTWSGGKVYNVSGNTNSCSSGSYVDNLTSELIYVLGNVTITSGSNLEGFMTVVAGASDSSGDTFSSSQAGTMTINGNVTYPGGDISSVGVEDADNSDGLGLIADYFIEPQTSGGNQPCSGGTEEIDAAILALQDSFYNPNWTSASVCTLKIVGSLAQSFRGPVAEGNSNGQTVNGYEKDYIWDSSLANYWPPYYLSPNSATWGPASYAEGSPGCAGRALGTSSTCWTGP